jgi:hypothetical protein
MKKTNLIALGLMSLLILMFFYSCSTAEKTKTADPQENQVITPTEKIELWNGSDLSGWKGWAEGTDVDINSVWSVKDGVIHTVGMPFGYLQTEKEYTNYKLHVEWRWVDEAGNSGVFVHKQGPDKKWPPLIEGQLMAGRAGDFVLLGGSSLIIDGESKRGKRKIAESSEKEPGEWNAFDIICKGDYIKLTVNGVVQNEASGFSLTSGKICLQSEGKPIQFRNVYIEPLP